MDMKTTRSKQQWLMMFASLALMATAAFPAGAADVTRAKEMDRTVLPIREPEYPAITELDARRAKAPPRFEVKAPSGAPNVVIVLLDDFGFGQASPFGGAIEMPTLERLANEGLKFSAFHVTALCSPTRMALLTGRNHHVGNMGSIAEMGTAFPGNTGVRPNSVAPLAEILRLNGYSTAYFGKCHEVPPWEISPSGPTDRWPTRSGFDKFYGFLGGETNQWSPLIYDGTVQVRPPRDPNYHFTTDMTDHTIDWIRIQQALTPDRPFFVYFAPGATHAPHHVPKEWIAKYKGRFDGGWDKLREEVLARQKKLGVVPADTDLTPMAPGIQAWESLSPEAKQLFARQMEVFAAYGAHTDHEVGRLVEAIETMDILDNTLFIYIAGDNGASAEGGPEGTSNETVHLNLVEDTIEEHLKLIDEWGGPMTFNHYSAGWAIAGNTPFQWAKQVASHFGGTRNPMVIRWPKGFKSRGEVRWQFHHVIDVAPTVLEAAGLPEPKVVNGTPQKPIEGVSMLYAFDNAEAKDRRTTQYFEMFGNRAIYHDGWVAAARHSIPFLPDVPGPLDQDKWELYHVAADFSEAHDLAAKYPEKLKGLQALFLKEAAKHHVLPLDDRRAERLNAAIAGRPDLMGPRTSITLYPGMEAINENAFINIKNRSHSITAETQIPEGGADGVIIAQGGRFAGWSLYVKDGRPAYVHNWLGKARYTIASPEPLPAGAAVIRYEFTFEGKQPGAGGTGVILVNGRKVAEGRIERTVPLAFSLDDGVNVGADLGTPVTEEYAQYDNQFTGTIRKVSVELTPRDQKSAAAEEQLERNVAFAKWLLD
jgi:arylsulfatase